MQVAFGAICRPVLSTATAVCMTAVLLGRYGARPRQSPLPSPSVRSPALPLHCGLSDHPCAEGKSQRWLLDRRTGGVFALLDPHVLDSLRPVRMFALAGWARDSITFAVRYKETFGKGAKLRLLEMGLARCTYPECRILNRVLLDPMPMSAIRWYPDRSDRIIYVATSARLYRYSFSGGEKFSGMIAQPIRRWQAATLAGRDASAFGMCAGRAILVLGRGALLSSLCFWDVILLPIAASSTPGGFA